MTQSLPVCDLPHQAGRNPACYGIKPGESLDVQLNRRIVDAVAELAKHGLVRKLLYRASSA